MPKKAALTSGWSDCWMIVGCMNKKEGKKLGHMEEYL
jgi:hypothetical protein